MRLAFTPRARRDLQEIGDYIARDGQVQALRFVDTLERRCTSPLVAPERYPLVVRHETRQTRRAPYGNYVIFYRLRAETVEILRVLHGARDLDAVIAAL